MKTDMQQFSSGWTIATYAAHNEALRAAEWKFQVERDRRYAEVDLERQRALLIKEEGDKAALLLARDIQTYKDEKANELRAQIESERGVYATKTDLAAAIDKLTETVKPLAEYVSVARGRSVGASASLGLIVTIIGIITGLILIGSFVFLNRPTAAAPQIMLVPAVPGTLIQSPQVPAVPK